MATTAPQSLQIHDAAAADSTLPSAFRALTGGIAFSTGLAVVLLAVGFACGNGLCASAAVCWALVVTGILGTHLAGRDIAWGWLLLVALQPLWIAYALTTGQYGFVVGAVACGLGHMHGFLRSRRNAGRREGRS